MNDFDVVTGPAVAPREPAAKRDESDAVVLPIPPSPPRREGKKEAAAVTPTARP